MSEAEQVQSYINSMLAGIVAMDGDGNLFKVSGALVVIESGVSETLVKLVSVEGDEVRFEPMSLFRDPDTYPTLFVSFADAMEKKAAMAADEAQS